MTYGYGNYGSYGSGRSRSRKQSFFSLSSKQVPQGESETLWRRFNTYGLPAVLLFVTCISTGSYYESNDDMALTLMLRGVYGTAPNGDLHLYLHGIGHLIAGMYRFLPRLPWYGLTMFAGLYLALAFSFGLLHRLSRRLLSNQAIALLLLFLYVASWLEHALWFNYTRVPLLLAAAAFISYAHSEKAAGPRHGRALALTALAFLLALCIRPSAGLLGLAIALPGALRVPARQKGIDARNLVTSLAPFAVVAVLFYTVGVLTRSADDVTYERLDHYNMEYQDFGTYYFDPTNRLDSVRVYAVREWMLGDRSTINEAFFHRAGGYEWEKYVSTRLMAKIKEFVPRVGRDYFLVLLLNLLIVWLCLRKITTPARRVLLLATQGWILGIFFVLGAFYKLPPRLIGPGLAILLLLNLAFYLRHRRTRVPHLPMVVWGLLVVAMAGHVYRTGWRVQMLASRQRRNEAYIGGLRQQFQDRLLVTSSLETRLSTLSPFVNYSFGKNKVFPLTGWNTLDPSYRTYYRALTGEESWARAIHKLAYDPRAVWIVTLGFDERLNRYLRELHADSVRLLPFEPYVVGPTSSSETMEFLVGVPPGRDLPLGRIPGRMIPPDSVASILRHR